MRKFRKKVKQAHQLAQVIADRCDFIVAERIATIAVDCGADFAVLWIPVKDPVEVSQIMCAFVYGATMADLEYEIRCKLCAVTVTLKNKNKKSKKTTKKTTNKAPIKAVTTNVVSV